ncbi:MAG: methyltransferase domain-containing protein [Actinomycetota bacterium]|nr:methyltransferase domain-containing protein [Actinomycetota bacterium]
MQRARRLAPALSDRLRFFRAFLAEPRLVGAVLPTSQRAVRDMLDLADVSGARRVVELGAGTGVYTGEILARLAPGAELLALEIDASLAGGLGERFADPRLRVVHGSAEHLDVHLADARADLIVSGLPFTSLGAGVRGRILQQARQALTPDGALLVLQYSPLIKPDLDRAFASVRWRVSPLNVPPAFLFACRQPRAAASGGRSSS